MRQARRRRPHPHLHDAGDHRLVRPMAPPGFEITESMVASFLGLGAVVNPLEDDLKFYKELSERYKEFLKAAKLDGKRLEPPQPKDGSFELWSYYHLGVPAFSMDLWTLPEVKAEEKEKTGITADIARSHDRRCVRGARRGEDRGVPEGGRRARQHQAGDALEGVKSAKMTPKQMAGMLKQMPKPKERGGADPEAEGAAGLQRQGARRARGSSPGRRSSTRRSARWRSAASRPFGDTTPPPAMIKPLLDGQVPWVLTLAGKLPRLKIVKSEATARGAGVYASRSGSRTRATCRSRRRWAREPARAAGRAAVRRQERAKDVTFLSGAARGRPSTRWTAAAA